MVALRSSLAGDGGVSIAATGFRFQISDFRFQICEAGEETAKGTLMGRDRWRWIAVRGSNLKSEITTSIHHHPPTVTRFPVN
jgi:hypothetical protein